MFTIDTHDGLAVAHLYVRGLRDDTGRRRLVRAKAFRCPLSALVARFAARRHPTRLAGMTA